MPRFLHFLDTTLARRFRQDYCTTVGTTDSENLPRRIGRSEDREIGAVWALKDLLIHNLQAARRRSKLSAASRVTRKVWSLACPRLQPLQPGLYFWTGRRIWPRKLLLLLSAAQQCKAIANASKGWSARTLEPAASQTLKPRCLLHDASSMTSFDTYVNLTWATHRKCPNISSGS